MSKVIDVYDDVFENHNAIILDDNMKQIHWKYDYHSNKKEVNKHSAMEDKFNQDIEELSQETENLVSEIEKWQT